MGAADLEAQASSALARLRRSGRELRKATWPGTEVDGASLEFYLRIVSNAEVQECHAAAFRRFEELKLPADHAHTIDLFEQEQALQLLYRACRSLERPHEASFFASVEELREYTTVQERDQVLELYADFEATHAPRLPQLSPDALAAMVELAKKKDAIRLRALGSATLASFAITTVGQQSS